MSDLFNKQSENAPAAPSELDLLKERARTLKINFSNNIGIDSLRERVNAKLNGEPEPAPTNFIPIVPDLAAQEAAAAKAEPEIEPLAQAPAEAPVNAFNAAAEVARMKDTLTEAQLTAPVVPETQQASYKPQLDHDRDGLNGGSNAKPERVLSLRARMQRDYMKLVRCRIANLDPKKANLPGEIFTIANEYLGTVKRFVPYGEVTEDGFHLPYVIFKNLEKRKFLHIRTTKDKRTNAPIVHSTWAKEFAIEVLPPLTQHELNQLAVAQVAAGSID